MKISANEEIKKSIPPQANRKEPSSRQMDFEALLKAEMNNAAKVHQATGSSIFVNTASAVQINASAADAPLSAVDRIENLLDLLDDYRTKLADPNVTLKDIHPLVSILDREKERLSPLLESLPADGNLKNILNHTLVTVSLEIMKYNRGDYITS
ncbi:MAG: hypothetical protein JSV83_15250 [Desulfobacterales bacterium]|nr:MAG: hypothetical protein JSV83_15250 [Desulfobacterales bacterium]